MIEVPRSVLYKAAQEVIEMLRQWAGTDRERWQRAYEKAQSKYRPQLEYNAFDHLVQWLASNRKVAEATHALKRLQGRRGSEEISRETAGHQADLSFYGRLIGKSELLLRNALLSDPKTVGFMRKLVVKEKQAAVETSGLWDSPEQFPPKEMQP
jgi:hypothetical protein